MEANLQRILEESRRNAERHRQRNQENELTRVIEASRRNAERQRQLAEEAELQETLEKSMREFEEVEAPRRFQENTETTVQATYAEFEKEILDGSFVFLQNKEQLLRDTILYFIETEVIFSASPYTKENTEPKKQAKKFLRKLQEILEKIISGDILPIPVEEITNAAELTILTGEEEVEDILEKLESSKKRIETLLKNENKKNLSARIDKQKIYIDEDYITSLSALLTNRVYTPLGLKRKDVLAANALYQKVLGKRKQMNAENAAKEEKERMEGEAKEATVKMAVKNLLEKERKKAHLQTDKQVVLNAESKMTAAKGESDRYAGNPRKLQAFTNAKKVYENAKQSFEAKYPGESLKGGKRGTRKLQRNKKTKKTRSHK